MTRSPDPVTPQPASGPGVTRFVAREEHRLSYESSGAASGAPVLALHDLLADRGQFRPLAEVLRAAGFRVTLPDARGHGASAMISGHSYSAGQGAADALAVLESEAMPAAHVVAVGWGAATALALAQAAPLRVASLVLGEPLLPGLRPVVADRSPDAPRREALLREAAQAAERGQTERALDLYLGLRFGAGWREALPKSRLAAARRAVGNLGPLLNGLADEALDREMLRRLELPVTLLLRSGATPEERGDIETLVSLLPRARRESVAATGGTASAPAAWMAAFASALGVPAPAGRS